MSKKLPGIYENPINREISNVQDAFYSDRSPRFAVDENINVDKEIRDIFASHEHVYRSNVLITTENGVSEKVIVGKTENSLLTLDNETIPISTIKNIKRI